MASNGMGHKNKARNAASVKAAQRYAAKSARVLEQRRPRNVTVAYRRTPLITGAQRATTGE